MQKAMHPATNVSVANGLPAANRATVEALVGQAV